MDLQEAKNEFHVKYYGWSMQEFRREVEEDFALLRRIKNSSIWRLLALMESLSTEEQIRLSVALVKRSHGEAVKTLGEHLAQSEQELIKRFRGSIVFPTPQEREIFELKRTGEWVSAKRKDIAKLIKEEFKNLKPIIGSLTWPSSSSGLHYRHTVNGWLVGTSIDLGGRFSLRYEHYIKTPEWLKIEEIYLSHLKNPEKVREKAISYSSLPKFADPQLAYGSYLSALGIGGADWEDLTPADVADTVKTLGTLCSKFLTAPPDLLPAVPAN